MSESSKTINIGIVGGGTVGGGIVEIIGKKNKYLQELTGKCISIKSISVRDVEKPRDFDIPDGCELV